MGNKATLKQIAQEVGLSPSSVSLVLNNRPCRISEENRKRIKEVAARNHYRLYVGPYADSSQAVSAGCGL